MRAGGATARAADTESLRALFGESVGQQIMGTINVYNDSVTMWNKLKGWASF
jgi:hypothetical protein